MKSQEQRIKRGTEEYRQLTQGRPLTDKEIVERILEAADREPPKWPTDETMKRLSWHFNGSRSEWTDETRAAVAETLRHQVEIIKAAVAYINHGARFADFCALRDAVKEAGLDREPPPWNESLAALKASAMVGPPEPYSHNWRAVIQEAVALRDSCRERGVPNYGAAELFAELNKAGL